MVHVRRLPGPHLVVVPLSVLFNWMQVSVYFILYTTHLYSSCSSFISYELLCCVVFVGVQEVVPLAQGMYVVYFILV